MSNQKPEISENSCMEEVLKAFPGAQRALFRRYHIGGCSHCAFHPSETLAEVCQRSDQLDIQEVLAYIQSSHEEDLRFLITPQALAKLLADNPGIKLLDIRSREEFEASRIEGSVLMTQQSTQDIMANWPPEDCLVIIDHQGQQGLDASAYFLGHGLKDVRCLQGGIDAWSQEVDVSIPRYRLA